jgi:large subunit ribosomal protein L35
MPKIKTNRGAAKRLKVTKKGKVKFQKARKRHLLESKSAKRKRQSSRPAYLSETHDKAVRQLLPYSF